MSAAPVHQHPQPALSPPEPTAGGRSRVAGLDVARGLALVGMIATHALPLAADDGSPTAVTTVAAGRAAATFVLVAGVGVALLSGGRHRLHGRERVAASAGILVRALAVGVLGLALGALSPANGIWGILPFYALLFVLVVPLLGLGARGAALVTAGVVAVGPVLLMAAEGMALPREGADDPTFADVLREPLAVLVQLLVTGAYPVVVLLGFLTAGLAVGRLDLSSRRVAWSLCAGGVALAVAARATSWVLLYPLGGLTRLVQDASVGDASVGDAAAPAEATTRLLWEEHQPLTTWWHLALPAPHSHTPVDLLHTLGSAVAVLGAALLLTRVPVLRRLLSPLAAAGSLVLTLYCAHLVLLATGVLSEDPVPLFLVMLVGALGFAEAWRRGIGQGPLEKAVSSAAGAVRRAVATRTARASGAAVPAGPGRPHRVVAPVAAVLLVVALGLAVRSQAGAGEPADDGEPPGVAAVTAVPAVPPPTGTGTARFCALTDRYATLLDTHPDDPGAVLDEGAATVRELVRSAPVELRGPVTTLVDDLRAEAGTAGVAAPGPATVESAETAVDEFLDDHCD